jgi:glutamine amidotransferase
MVGFVEATAARHGIQQPLQMTIGASDGERLWAFRYSSEGRSRSLFYSTQMHTLRELYPDNPVLHQVAEHTRLVVSEPLGDLAGAWNEVPESSYGLVHKGHDELHPFEPRLP